MYDQSTNTENHTHTPSASDQTTQIVQRCSPQIQETEIGCIQEKMFHRGSFGLPHSSNTANNAGKSTRLTSQIGTINLGIQSLSHSHLFVSRVHHQGLCAYAHTHSTLPHESQGLPFAASQHREMRLIFYLASSCIYQQTARMSPFHQTVLCIAKQ